MSDQKKIESHVKHYAVLGVGLCLAFGAGLGTALKNLGSGWQFRFYSMSHMVENFMPRLSHIVAGVASVLCLVMFISNDCTWMWSVPWNVTVVVCLLATLAGVMFTIWGMAYLYVGIPVAIIINLVDRERRNVFGGASLISGLVYLLGMLAISILPRVLLVPLPFLD